jgi:hypothetical protein
MAYKRHDGVQMSDKYTHNGDKQHGRQAQQKFSANELRGRNNQQAISRQGA